MGILGVKTECTTLPTREPAEPLPLVFPNPLSILVVSILQELFCWF